MFKGKPLVKGTLLADVKRAGRGSTFRAGVLFKMAPGWHIYWRNPGDSGLPTRLIWFARGARFGDQVWPMPLVRRDARAAMTTYEYGGQTLISVPVTVGKKHEGAALDLRVRVHLLACKKVCIKGVLAMRRSVPVGALQEAMSPEELWTFKRFSDHLPRPANQLGYAQRWSVVDEEDREPGNVRIRAELKCKGSGCPQLLAPAVPASAYLPLSGALESVIVESVQVVRGGKGLRVLLSAEFDPEGATGSLDFKGIFSLRSKGGGPVALEVSGAVPRPKERNDA